MEAKRNMKATELRELPIEELKNRLKGEEENLSNLRFQLSTSQLENPIKVRLVRKDIARIQTVIAEKVMASNTPKTEVKKS
jgi:large subunit ribosomal protein L29